jgi:carbonic anhydrase
VVPELITGADPGELFDVRNIANVVPPAGSAACATGAAVEYAVIHLKVSHIVVCGHTECGGIKALETPPDPNSQPHIASWLELARPARDQVLDTDVPEADRYLETIKTNVLMQCENLRSYPCVAAGEQSGGLSIHPWLYDLRTGRILAFDEGAARWDAVAEQQP